MTFLRFSISCEDFLKQSNLVAYNVSVDSYSNLMPQQHVDPEDRDINLQNHGHNWDS